MTDSSERSGLRTWVEVDVSAVRKNIRTFRAVAPAPVKLLAVVKSNAYGHGLVGFAKAAEAEGADMLGVDSLVEGLALRREGVELPIVTLGYTLPERLEEAARDGVAVSLSSFEQVPHFAQAAHAGGTPLAVHVKADTGMHRQGFLADDRNRLLDVLKRHAKEIRVEGLFTHFAAAKNPAFPAYTKEQIAAFEEWRTAFSAAGFAPICHASATAGALLFPEAHYDMVRIGIGLYGLPPSRETSEATKGRWPLVPALSWRTIISETKRLPKGAKIGYDCTETLWRDSLVGVCPIGYWHGYPRALSSVGHVLVRGTRARLLGRVSMDMITVDLTDVPNAAAGDVATLLGADGDGYVGAEEVAAVMDASHYELVTRINPLIKRLYV